MLIIGDGIYTYFDKAVHGHPNISDAKGNFLTDKMVNSGHYL